MDSDAMYRSYFSSVTKEELEQFKRDMDELGKADAKTKKEFYTSIGLYDENGNIAEGYRDLFEETE
ncbi:MAG: hypothetical protein LBB30_00730 [Candidatus Methanoplasma sp.]|jgi:hypothetical protein|nr:hypothetical protein [Candidatus Methanoplasma sp.]